MTLAQIHGRIASAAFLFMLLAALWGLLRWLRKQRMDENYVGVLVVGEFLLAVQVLLGLWMWLGTGATANADRPWMHYLYGFVSVLTLPAVYAFSQGSTEKPRDQGLYAVACLLLVGIIWRSMTTAGF